MRAALTLERFPKIERAADSDSASADGAAAKRESLMAKRSSLSRHDAEADALVVSAKRVARLRECTGA